MEVKQKITREKIISTAFIEWAKSMFWHSPMQAVSDKLGISKTALYRHFKNKEELLNSMEDTFIGAIRNIAQKVAKEVAGKSFKEKIRISIETYCRFYTEYPYYLYFHIFCHNQKRVLTPGLRQDIFDEIESLLPSGNGIKSPLFHNEQDMNDFLLLHRGIVFFLPFFLEDPHPSSFGLNTFNKNSGENIVSLLYQVNLYGFNNKKPVKEPDYHTIENYFNFKEDIFSRERIVNAVYDVVSSEGLHKASVSKIAGRLGIRKSSIYHYFKHKSDLLKTMINQSGEKLDLYFKKSISSFEKAVDRLYCLFIITASYFYYTRPAIHLYSWLIFNKMIDKEYLKPPPFWSSERFRVFEKIVRDEKMRTYNLDTKILFSYINYHILTSILTPVASPRKGMEKKQQGDQEEMEKDRIIQNIRHLYNYFQYGFSGGNNEL